MGGSSEPPTHLSDDVDADPESVARTICLRLLTIRARTRAELDEALTARAVPREDLRRGAEELGLPLEEHIANVIRFLRERADALGLAGTA